MKKIHSVLWVLLGTGAFFVTLLGLGLMKLLPSLEQNIYYCQAFIQSLSVQLFTGQLHALITLSLFAVSVFIFFKIAIVFYRVQMLKKQHVAFTHLPNHVIKILNKHHLHTSVFFIDTRDSYAFCFGFLKPKIYVSTRLLEIMNSKEIEAILLHEKYHMDHKDSLIMTIFSTVPILFPFFPFMGDLVQNHKLSTEINADKFAVDLLKDKKPLLSVLRKLISSSSFPSLAVSSIADETLASRIRILLSREPYKLRLHIKNILISGLSLMMFIGVLVSPSKATEVCLTGTNCTIWCATGQSTVPIPTLRASYPYSASH